MTVLQKIKETLGFDIKKDEYAFGFDPQYGYLSQKKFPSAGSRPPAATARSVVAW